MEAKGVPPDAVTYGCILKTCSILGALQIGESIVKQISKRGLLQNDVVLGNTLLDMYSKCGALKKALEVFEQLPVRDVVCWNVLIGGYAQLGNANAVFYLYTMMKLANIAPNSVTFILLLTACSHAGLLKEGENLFFNEMHIVNNLDPVVEHYTCMIDLFGRAGHIEKAKALLENVSHCGHIVPFLTMLAACRKWRNVSFGRWAFEHSVELDATCSAAYFCMEQIYATAGLQAEAERIEALRTKNKATTLRRHCSWTDGLGNMHSFLVSDKSHPQSRRIQAKLEDIQRKLLQEGYLQHWDQVLISDDKRENLCSHSATMSIACAIINTHQGMPVHVTKNVRLCNSCHTASLLVSLVEKRRIVVRDATRIHLFEGGRCMCNDHDF
jgi:pentatricopeptide repeat protein